MKKKVKITLFAVLLLMGCVNVEAQEPLTPEFELFHEFSGQVNIYDGAVVELESGDFIVPYNSINYDYTNGTPGLHKISSDGAIVSDLIITIPDDYVLPKIPFVVKTRNNGLYVLGTYEPFYMQSDSDEAVIFISKIDEDLKILESNEYNIKIDTTSDYYVYYTAMLSAFETDDGIWACFHKSVPTFNTFGNDSILFWKFDYDGNIVETKFKELDGRGNYTAFVGNKVKESTSGYDLIIADLKSAQRSRQLVVQKYDKDFNFIEEVERSSSNPEFYADVSVKALCSGNTIVSSWYYHFHNGDGVALTIFDNDLNKIKEQTYQGVSGWDVFSGTWSSVDFINENRIFWAYTDHYSMNSTHDYDSWIGINLLTADLEIEHTYFYDMYGDKSWMRLSTTKATRDGGLLLTVSCPEIG